MRRRVVVSGGVIAAVLLLAAPTAAWAYSSVQFSYNTSVTNGGSVTSVLGTHVGGQGYALPCCVGGTLRVTLLQGSGTIAYAEGGALSYVSIGPYSSSYANSRVQCRWSSTNGSTGGLDCFRFTP